MGEFIKYVRTNGSGEQVVFINVQHINAAVFDQQAGTMKITTAQGQSETLSGQYAKDALAVINKMAEN